MYSSVYIKKDITHEISYWFTFQIVSNVNAVNCFLKLFFKFMAHFTYQDCV